MSFACQATPSDGWWEKSPTGFLRIHAGPVNADAFVQNRSRSSRRSPARSSLLTKSSGRSSARTFTQFEIHLRQFRCRFM
jgi:hypothetical protein